MRFRTLYCTFGAAIVPALMTGSWQLEAQQKAAEPSPVAIASPTIVCSAPGSRDQDDMCIWIHPTDTAKSTVITSDKYDNKLFVYDLGGHPIQAISTIKPGNIDIRYGFPLQSKKVDIVVFNQREGGYKLLVYKVNSATRRLERIDNGAIITGENYGGTLYHSPKTGKFYFLSTSETGSVEQYELADDGTGKVTGTKVRSWTIGKCEGAVADDQMGKIYIGEEAKGVWEVGGEPDDPVPGELVIQIGQHGLTGDVEGLAIYFLPDGDGYLIVSDQGQSQFKVYQRQGAHRFLGSFSIQGSHETDGIDVCNMSLGSRFPKGLFACHSARGNRPVLVTPWEAVAGAMSPKLKVDTRGDPRK